MGYILLGMLFMMIVYRKEVRHRKLSLEHRKKFGIPQHFGMYYAMGVALIMEGIMSGCYHVCPNHTNFQFDTAFMYTISILILLKIYQTRHPDINANAYSAFGVLAFIIFIGVIGVLHGNLLFWVLFSGLHISSCLVLSFQVNLFVFLQNRPDKKIIKGKILLQFSQKTEEIFAYFVQSFG